MSIKADVISPPTAQTTDRMAEIHKIGKKRDVRFSAAIMGNDNIDINIMMPARRMVSTMHIATRAVMA